MKVCDHLSKGNNSGQEDFTELDRTEDTTSDEDDEFVNRYVVGNEKEIDSGSAITQTDLVRRPDRAGRDPLTFRIHSLMATKTIPFLMMGR